MKLGRRVVMVVCVGCLAGLAACVSAPGDVPLPAGTAAGEEGGRADSLLAMGDRAAEAGDSQTAIAYYEKAAGLRATDTVALSRAGSVLLRDRRWQDAADMYRRALTQSPSNAEAHRGYARALLGLDQAGAASAHLEEALRAEPDDVRTLNMLGVAYDMVGRGGAAISTYKRALELAPGDRQVVNNLGLSLALAGDFDGALGRLEPLANGPDSTAQARQNLALVYALEGDMLAAERIGRLDLDPASVRGNMAFAAALRAAGDPASSASALLTEVAVDKPRKAPKAEPPTASAPERPPAAEAPRPLTADPVAAPTTWTASLARTSVEPVAASALPVTPAALALDEADMISGLAPTGGWLIELGTFADRPQAAAAWRRLRGAHPDLLGGMTRLAGTERGSQPLLAGPLATEGEADRICGSLTAKGVSCSKLQV